MRRPALLALAVALCAHPLRAQFERPTRAFETAVVPAIGFAGFGERFEDIRRSRFQYNASLALGAQLQRGLTRRTGVMATVLLAPLSHVLENGADESTIVGSRAIIGVVDAGVAGRLKPRVPVYGYLGGGMLVGTRPPATATTGSYLEPRATFGFGVDAMRGSRGGLRVTYLGHVAFPHDPGGVPYARERSVYDWTLLAGARIPLGRSDR